MKNIFLFIVVFSLFFSASTIFAETDTAELSPLHQHPNVSNCTDLKSGYVISIRRDVVLFDNRGLVPDESDPSILYLSWVTPDPSRDNVKMNCQSSYKVTIEVTGTPIIVIHNNPFSLNPAQAGI